MQHCVQGTNISFHFIIHTYIPLDRHTSVNHKHAKEQQLDAPRKKASLQFIILQENSFSPVQYCYFVDVNCKWRQYS